MCSGFFNTNLFPKVMGTELGEKDQSLQQTAIWLRLESSLGFGSKVEEATDCRHEMRVYEKHRATTVSNFHLPGRQAPSLRWQQNRQRSQETKRSKKQCQRALSVCFPRSLPPHVMIHYHSGCLHLLALSRSHSRSSSNLHILLHRTGQTSARSLSLYVKETTNLLLRQQTSPALGQRSQNPTRSIREIQHDNSPSLRSPRKHLLSHMNKRKNHS